jgi:hypothetical protein
VRRETEVATPYSPTHQLSDERRDGILRISVTGPVRGDVDLVLPSGAG